MSSTEEYRSRINQISENVKEEPEMRKMRDDISEGIGTTGNRQADVEEQFQQVIEETTDKDIVSAPEIIAARNGKPNLKQRLDDENENVTRQLAHKVDGNVFRKDSAIDKTSFGSLVNSKRLFNSITKTVKDIAFNSSSPYHYFTSIVKKDGVIYVAYRLSSGHGVITSSTIRMVESADEGSTWTNDRLVVDNVGYDPRDPDLFLTSDGRIILKWFDHDGTNVISKIKISLDGKTYGNDIALPSPPNYGGSATVTKGTMAEIDGSFYIALYTGENIAYVVKSDNLSTWSFQSYINENVTLNETSLAYIPSEKALYAISRQGKSTGGNVLFADYANKLFISVSYDLGITWVTGRELEVYGHAPSTITVGDEIIVVYKNTYTLENPNKNYTLDMVKVKNGKINGFSKTLTNTSTHDAFYTGIIKDGSNFYISYYAFFGASSVLKMITFKESEISKLNFEDGKMFIGESGWKEKNGTIETWVMYNPNEWLTAGEKKTYSFPNSRDFTVRPLGGFASIDDITSAPPGTLDNVVVNVRVLNAVQSTIKLTLWNTNTESVPIGKVRVYTFGM